MGLSNSQYLEIMQEYDQIRQREERILDKKREEIYKLIPRVKEIDREIIEESMSFARESLFNKSLGGEDLEDLDERLKKLSKRKRRMLSSEGFPEDYLDIKYRCPDCKDTGYINDEKCHCLKQAITNYLFNASGIYEKLLKASLSDFTLEYYDDSFEIPSIRSTAREYMEENFSKIKAFVNAYPDRYENFLFYGNSGLGKTFLSMAVAGELMAKGADVVYLTAYELIKVFESSDYGSKTEDKYINSISDSQIFSCDLLIIDDLGTEVSNTFTNSKLNVCINERILNKKSTIISTNYSMSELSAAYSERIFSRLVGEYKLIRFVGEDIRLQRRGVSTR